MRIIDAFCGVGPWAHRDRILPYRPEDTLAIMDHCGIEAALVYGNHACSWARSHEANRAAAEAARSSDRFIPAFVIAPQPYDDVGYIEEYARRMADAGAKAAWVWPHQGKQSHGLWSWLVGGLFSLCSRCRLPLFLPVDAASPDRIDTICRDFPDLRVVLANMDYRVDGWLFPLLRRHPQLRVCLGPAYVTPVGIDRFVKHFGSERLIFGSGLPHYSPGGLIGHVMYSGIDDDDKQRILSGNVETLMQEVEL